MSTRKAGRTTKPATPDVQAVEAVQDDPNVVITYPDLRDLTVGQIEEIEDLTDGPLGNPLDPERKLGKLHRAIAYVLRKAEDPKLTWEQAAELKLYFRLESAPVPPTAESA